MQFASAAIIPILAFLGGLLLYPISSDILDHPARYVATALFGVLVGTTELISRYRDRPTAPLQTTPGVIYLVTNGLASIGALWVLQQQGVTYDFGGKLPPALAQVLLAGFGTMVFFRSALFSLRVGDSDVAIGPAAVLQIILNAADRACDRQRAAPRSTIVHDVMRGVSFERARVALPVHCFALMQNVSITEQTQVVQAIDAIAKATTNDEVKSYNLGLLLMNVVGEDVLQDAVKVLGPLILGPASDEPPILAQAATLTEQQVTSLIDVCVALDPLTRDDAATGIHRSIADATGGMSDAPTKNLIALLQLRGRFGAATVARALALVTAARPTGKVLETPLVLPDLDPKKPATS